MIIWVSLIFFYVKVLLWVFFDYSKFLSQCYPNRGLGKYWIEFSKWRALSQRCSWNKTLRPSDQKVVLKKIWSFCYVMKMREQNVRHFGRLESGLLVLRIHKGTVHDAILRYNNYCSQVSISKEFCYIWFLWQLLREALSWKLSISLNTWVEMSIKGMV